MCNIIDDPDHIGTYPSPEIVNGPVQARSAEEASNLEVSIIHQARCLYNGYVLLGTVHCAVL